MDGMMQQPVVQPVEVPSLAPPPPLDVSDGGTHMPCFHRVYTRAEQTNASVFCFGARDVAQLEESATLCALPCCLTCYPLTVSCWAPPLVGGQFLDSQVVYDHARLTPFQLCLSIVSQTCDTQSQNFNFPECTMFRFIGLSCGVCGCSSSA